MDTLHWSNLDKNNFSVFIRDLSKNLTNVKHLIEDSFKEESKPTKNFHKQRNKKVVKKKKDIIIEQQTKVRLEKQMKEDLSKLDYIMETINYENPYVAFKLMKTEHGLLHLKYRMLDHFWKLRKEHMPHVMNLYFQLIDVTLHDDLKDLLEVIHKRLDGYEYKLYMMKYLGYMLPPLNIYEYREKKLDDWQKEVINYIKQGESVIVKAPTSSGKSFVGLGAGIIHKRILYVCPAKPIAYQVGAHFVHMGYKVHYLVENLCDLSYDDKTSIFIGIPETIEDNLYKVGVTFDYAVFDEIHNLNKEDDGNIYENIIKLIRCPFLALSATIGNIDYLREVFTRIHNDDLTNKREEQHKKTLLVTGSSYKLSTTIHYVEYTKRFINQQKMIWVNKSLQHLHPLACIELSDLTDKFLQNNLQFTPYDSAILWEKIEDVFSEHDFIDDYSPDNYFPDDSKILTLDDTRDYEYFIKSKLVELAPLYPDLVKEVIDSFHIDSDNDPDNSLKDIIDLFKNCKDTKCLPMLAFNTDTTLCKKLFTGLFTTISKLETECYPYHYDILEKKEELYSKYEESRVSFIDNIKINKNSKDAQSDKQSKVDRFDREQERKFTQDISNYYETCIHNCDRNESISPTLKKLQIKNLRKELKDWTTYPSFGHQDVFKKHKDFCFSNSEPMTGDQIRSVRREIHKTLGLKISYEHELFQMLKRGIGIYTEEMPDEYKWILQKLMDDKKIGIVISDRTLCLGIDLPIRSSLLLGLPDSTYFSTDDYLQMSGRAGRRGKDDRGNTIFYNVDFRGLMKGVLPDIVGAPNEVPSNYHILNSDISEVYKNPINPLKIIDTRDFITTDMPKLQWALRYQGYVPEFIKDIQKWNKKVYNAVEDIDKEVVILQQLILLTPYEDTIIHHYKSKVIESDSYQYKHICELIQVVYNSLKDKRYIHLKKYMEKVHINLKDMLLKYQGLC